jgi:hypothetical protein
MAGGAHLKAMPKLMEWCDEASVVHWTQEGSTPPSWEEADRRMRTQGRPSKVRYPSADHARLNVAAPRTTRAAPIKPMSRAVGAGDNDRGRAGSVPNRRYSERTVRNRPVRPELLLHGVDGGHRD